MENKNKFKIVSRVYGNNFETVTFVIFNSETGELSKEVINNNIDEREIRAETADNIRDEIKRLLNGNPNTEAEYIWNHSLNIAAECCNGYKEEE